MQFEVVLEEGHPLRHLAPQGAHAATQALAGALAGVAAFEGRGGAQLGLEHFEDGGPLPLDPGVAELYAQHLAEQVGHEAWRTVGLAVQHPHGVGLGHAPLAAFQGGPDLRAVEGLVDVLALQGQHPERRGPGRIEVASPDERAALRVHVDHVARLNARVGTENIAAVSERIAAPQSALGGGPHGDPHRRAS